MFQQLNTIVAQLACLLLVLFVGVRGDPPTPTGPSTPTGPQSPNGPGSPTTLAPPNDPLITLGGSSFEGSFVGGTTLAANSDGAYNIGSQTLERGSQIVVSLTTYSLGPGGREIVVNGQTSQITQGAGGYVPCFALPINGYQGGCLGEASGVDQTSTAAAATTTSVQSSVSQQSEGSTTAVITTSSTSSLASMTSSASAAATSTTGSSASSLRISSDLVVTLRGYGLAVHGLVAAASMPFCLAVAAILS